MSNNITAETTDGQILGPIESARAALHGYVIAHMDDAHQVGEEFVSMAQKVRNAEALAAAQMGFRAVLANTPDNALFYLLDLTTRREDTWSGRGNDSRRSADDAVLRWASDTAVSIRVAMKVAK